MLRHLQVDPNKGVLVLHKNLLDSTNNFNIRRKAVGKDP